MLLVKDRLVRVGSNLCILARSPRGPVACKYAQLGTTDAPDEVVSEYVQATITTFAAEPSMCAARAPMESGGEQHLCRLRA